MTHAVQEIPMPQVSEEVNEYTLTTWHKQPGSAVAVGEVIAEAMTEKANVEIESPVAGTLKEVLIAEEHTVAAGQAIARVAPT